MIIDGTTPGERNVYDCAGNVIPGVVSYDTETSEVEMAIFLLQQEGASFRPILRAISKEGGSEPLIVKIRIPGSYAILNGQKI